MLQFAYHFDYFFIDKNIVLTHSNDSQRKSLSLSEKLELARAKSEAPVKKFII